MLISHSSLLLFVTGAAILLVIPGPAVTYVVSRSIGHGRAAGLVSVMGIVAGTLCHVVAAATTWHKVPATMPMTETRPAARPCPMLRLTTYVTAGPGITNRIAAPVTNNNSDEWLINIGWGLP